MTTPSICDPATRVHTRARNQAAAGMLVCAASLVLTGCTYSGGQLAFFSGLFQNKKVDAKCQLGPDPILILVDDAQERVDWPVFTRLLNDDLAQELLRNKAAKKIVPVQTLQSLRAAHADFDSRGCREVGELAGASKVVWVEIQDFYVTDDPTTDTHAAYAVASVKVINVHEPDRWKVREWPAGAEGEMASVNLAADQVIRAGSKDAIAKDISAELAESIAKFFYDRRLGDFELES